MGEIFVELGKALALEAGKAAVAYGVKAGVDKLTEDKEETPTYDANAENKKAQLASAKGARKRISQQTQTLLTSPLGGLGRVGGVGGGVAKTLLGM